MATTKKKFDPVLKITFRDGGQDFIDWYVRDHTVIDCQPFQGSIWVDKYVVNDTVKRGGIVVIANDNGDTTMQIKYKIKKVSIINDQKELDRLDKIYKQWKLIKAD